MVADVSEISSIAKDAIDSCLVGKIVNTKLAVSPYSEVVLSTQVVHALFCELFINDVLRLLDRKL